MVTFGGAYAVLAYVAQQAVEHYHWVGPREMPGRIGVAETTPGPLIMVLQFVASWLPIATPARCRRCWRARSAVAGRPG